MNLREATCRLLFFDALIPLDLMLYFTNELLVPAKRARLLIERRVVALVALDQVRRSLKKLVSVRAESLTYTLGLGVVSNPVREDGSAKLKGFLLVNVERAGHLVVVG